MIKRNKNLRKVCHLIYEGQSEQTLINYLKNYSRSKIKFNPESLRGVSTYREIESVIEKVRRKYYDFDDKMLFIVIDNDMPDSANIVKKLEEKDYKFVALEPNCEGFLLRLCNTPIPECDPLTGIDIKLKIFT